MKPVFAVICFLCFLCFSGQTVKAEDDDIVLEWKGKPISPLCFDPLVPLSNDEPPKFVDIATCEENIINENNKIYKTYKFDGKLITTFGEKDIVESFKPAYALYKVIGKIDKGYVVYVEVGGGGSGEFGNIVIVNIDNDKLINIDRIKGGDRCNGGITSLEVIDNKIKKIVNATPMDIVDLAYGNDGNLKAYDDLEASAGSCFADVTYIDNVFKEIHFNKDAIDKYSQEWTNRYKYQNCFNNVFIKQIDKKSDFNHYELKKFVDVFFANCVKKGKKNE